ncbi:uncharacterized protein LOC121539700 [Coregonus clupeaformis]|uniref:uncharacterized protein LOC121539700 n=1 Tax=Coregonus clupeaformis TaxID=59861 RepID=UPI001E1C43B7|nr:uncharacterized protein LOC121539700 [Coregonus clupeaformis]
MESAIKLCNCLKVTIGLMQHHLLLASTLAGKQQHHLLLASTLAGKQQHCFLLASTLAGKQQHHLLLASTLAGKRQHHLLLASTLAGKRQHHLLLASTLAGKQQHRLLLTSSLAGKQQHHFLLASTLAGKQQHCFLLASTLAGTGHLKAVNLSHNALGSMGFELVLKTLPLHCLTHLHLAAIRCEPSDHPALEHLRSVLLSQDDCSLTHLSLAGNGRQRSHPRQGVYLCPSVVSLDLSENPAVTSVGLHSLLSTQRPLTYFNLQVTVVRQPDPGTTLVWTACQNRSRTCGCGCAHRSSTNWTVRRCSRHGARGG